MMSDGRKTLRAHWPPRRTQTVQLQLNEELYADVYEAAQRNGWSLQDELRQRIRVVMETRL